MLLVHLFINKHLLSTGCIVVIFIEKTDLKLYCVLTDVAKRWPLCESGRKGVFYSALSYQW